MSKLAPLFLLTCCALLAFQAGQAAAGAAPRSCAWQLAGRMVTPDGEPASGVAVRFEAASVEGRARLESREMTTDGRGLFRLGSGETDAGCEQEWKVGILAKVPRGEKWGLTVSVSGMPVDGGFRLPKDVVIAAMPPDGFGSGEEERQRDRPAGPDGKPLCECGLGPGDPETVEVRPGVFVTIQDECGHFGWHYCDNCEC